MSVLKELIEKRDAASEELKGILTDPETGADREDLTEEQETRSRELLDDISAYDERIEAETRDEKNRRRLAEARKLVAETKPADDGTRVSVEAEAPVYGPNSPNSYYYDLITVNRRSSMDPVRDQAEARMRTWGHQVEREIAHGSKAGKAAEKQVRELYRNSNLDVKALLTELRTRGAIALEDKGAELRAIATGGGATASAGGGGAAAFVTPIFTEPDYVPYREYGRAFADQCYKRPLPDYGMEIYKPQVTGPAEIEAFTENGSVAETDPTAGYVSASLAIYAGQVVVSQAVLDRTGPNFSFDEMIFDQLQRDYAPKFDTAVITASLANATSQNWTGNSNVFVVGTTSGSGGFYGQVSKAKAKIRTTAGTVLNPTHLFTTPARWEFIAAWADSNGRPLVVPDYAGPFNAAANSGDGDAGIEGYTGARFNGLRAFTDNNIPTTTTAHFDQAVVADLSQVWVYEGTPVTRVLPQTNASNLEVILQQYSYGAVLVNYNASVVAINGTGMSSISYTN